MGRERLNKDDKNNVLEHKGLVTDEKQKKKQGNDKIDGKNNDDQFMSDPDRDKKVVVKKILNWKSRKKIQR